MAGELESILPTSLGRVGRATGGTDTSPMKESTDNPNSSIESPYSPSKTAVFGFQEGCSEFSVISVVVRVSRIRDVNPDSVSNVETLHHSIFDMAAQITLRCPFCGRVAVPEGRRPGGVFFFVPLGTPPKAELGWGGRVSTGQKNSSALPIHPNQNSAAKLANTSQYHRK